MKDIFVICRRSCAATLFSLGEDIANDMEQIKLESGSNTLEQRDFLDTDYLSSNLTELCSVENAGFLQESIH